MPLSLNSNIASLNAQRRLGVATAALGKSNERLASGLRINRASDDAAGMSVYLGLSSESRVYQQGIRNINDAVSLYSIAQGSVGSLSDILFRMTELAEQSANGTLTRTQRVSLDAEAQALKSEFDRIVETTQFNGRTLLQFGDSTLSVQAGYGSDGTIDLRIGGELPTATIAAGTFKTETLYDSASSYRLVAADFNEDGNIDLAGSTGRVIFGNGDGTFKSPVNLAAGNAYGVEAGDLNGDGNADVVTLNGLGVAFASLGDGNGSFSAVQTIGGTLLEQVDLGDVDGDGDLDMVGTDGVNEIYSVLLNSGTGTFSAGTTYVARVNVPSGTSGMSNSIQFKDVNSDGKLDLVGTSFSDHRITVLIGNGNGTFKAAESYSANGVSSNNVVDVNGDGNLDFVYSRSSTTGFGVQLGNGNGTFKAEVQYGTTGATTANTVVSDFNSDGKMDIITRDGSTRNILYLGNGDGTFTVSGSFAVSGLAYDMLTADVNNDGVNDVISSASVLSQIGISVTEGTSKTGLRSFSLTTQEEALQALDYFKLSLQKVSAEMGSIGSSQARLESAASNLSTISLNLTNAASRISDVDVAEESSVLLKTQIIQQAASSVLAQANIQPQLALSLIGG